MPDPEVTGQFLRGWPIPLPGEDGDKNDRGQVLVVGGSVPVPGGPLLAALAAIRAGAGKLQIATVAPAAIPLGVAVTEALVAGFPATADGGIDPDAADGILELAATADAVLIGPGMKDADAIGALLAKLLPRLTAGGPVLVVDAGAILALEPKTHALRHLEGGVILTPNTDELAAIAGVERDVVEADARAVVVDVATAVGAAVAVKGWVAAPDGRCWSHEGGTVGLGTSGSGDVLAGCVAGLAARGAEPAQAAAWGLYAHGRAGEVLSERFGPVGFLARELLDELPAVLAHP